MKLIKDINEMAVGQTLSADHREVVARLAEFWREQGVDDMSDDELGEAIAMDMENVPGVEGDPDLMDKLVPLVVSMVRGG